ncbi:uncharacterized protein LOC141608885 [Silene latifolia]|uniref:uncharacterized protein LOC141608885 n=1 Tax=Silene latifolia TaxID=37657 RepID=UPI003D773D1E
MMGKSCASSSNSWNSRLKNTVLCKHNIGAVLKTVKHGEHVGKTFYGCSLWPYNSCGFFQFVDVMTESEDLEKKNDLLEKMKNLKIKNEKLKMVVVELNIEIMKHRKSEKLVIVALLVSLVLFAMFVYSNS